MPAAANSLQGDWWLTPLAQLQTELAATTEGLSAREAAERLRRFGANSLRDAARVPLIVQFLSRFRNPLVLILLAASAIAAATGEVVSFAIIAATVVFSVTLDFVQSNRSPPRCW